MRLDEFHAYLRSKLGVETLPLDSDGHCRLTFAGGLDVEIFVHGRDRLFFVAPLEKLPDDDFERQNKIRSLLQFSLAVARDRQEVLALPEDSDKPVIYRRLAMDELAVDKAYELLDDFLDELELWLRREDEKPARQPPPMPHHIVIP